MGELHAPPSRSQCQRRGMAIVCPPCLGDRLQINLLNVLVRACSTTLRLLQTKVRAASTISCLTALGLSCASAAAQGIRIQHVTVVSPERERPLPDATVYIQGDRIVSISAASSVVAQRPETNTEVIDGHGLYLAPGLIDSHVHVDQLPGMTAEQERAHTDI